MSSTNSQQQAEKAAGYRMPYFPGLEPDEVEIAKAADFYGTPAEAFLPLIPYLQTIGAGTIHEPCCGDGRLVNWMRVAGIIATGSDLRVVKYDEPFLAAGVDFLADTTPRDHIVTNPPFSLAQEIIDHSFKVTKGEIWMLLRLNFLGSKKRRQWWIEHEPKAIFVLSDRPDFTGDGGDSCEYAWLAWQNRFKGIFHL